MVKHHQELFYYHQVLNELDTMPFKLKEMCKYGGDSIPYPAFIEVENIDRPKSAKAYLQGGLIIFYEKGSRHLIRHEAMHYMNSMTDPTQVNENVVGYNKASGECLDQMTAYLMNKLLETKDKYQNINSRFRHYRAFRNR